MCEWRRIQTKRKRKLKGFPGARGSEDDEPLPLAFGAGSRGAGANRQPATWVIFRDYPLSQQMIGADFTAESAFGTLDKQWVPMTINYRQLVSYNKNNRLEFIDYKLASFQTTML